MIGFLRFVGITNTALWLGGSFFCALQVGSSLFLPEMGPMLGASNSSFFPYLSGAVPQIVMQRCFEFQLVCAVIAWLHALAEWLYLGMPSRKVSFSVLSLLLALVLIGAFGLQPKLKQLNEAQYKAPQAATKEAAARSYKTWQIAGKFMNVVIVLGLTLYLWRLANPPGTHRFVSSVKFRG